jgi:hypothetical protein
MAMTYDTAPVFKTSDLIRSYISKPTSMPFLNTTNRNPIQDSTRQAYLQLVEASRQSDIYALMGYNKIIIIIIIIIIMPVVPLGSWVVYKSSSALSAPGDKPEISPAALPTFIQCSSYNKFISL